MTDEFEVDNFGRGATGLVAPDGNDPLESFMSGADWPSLIHDLLSKNRGLVLFIFPIPKDPQLFEKFPEPALPEGFDGFLDWTDGVFKAPISPLKFNPKVHAYAVTHMDPPSLIIGVIGPLSFIYKWAEAYLRNISKESRFRSWIEEATWLTHEDILFIETGENPPEGMDALPEHEETADLPKTVDIEDDKTVAGLMYTGEAPLTKAEEDELHDKIQE